MEFSVFRECVLEKLREIIKSDDEVKLFCATKNNGIEQWSVIIKEPGLNISPTIYLETYYEEYVSSICDITTIAREIYDFYLSHKMDVPFDAESFFDYKKVKERIYCKLINTKKNEELLKKVPHKEFLDLSIVFYFMMCEQEEGTQTVLIYNNHLKIWNIDLEQLYIQATKNTINGQNVELKTMSGIIFELTGNIAADKKDDIDSMEEYLKEITQNEQNSDFPMYVLTNKSKVYGATCMLYKNLLKSFADSMMSDIYILPSSIHEVILIPLRTKDSIAEYRNMVKEVNETELDPQEILSDNVYIYNRETDEIILPAV